MDSLIFTLFIISAIASCSYYFYHFQIPHTYYGSYEFLSADATIVSIKNDKERWGRNKHIKTIVRFSDGFEYHTFQHRRVGYIIYVDEDVIKSIVERAIKAHFRIIRKKHGGKTF